MRIHSMIFAVLVTASTIAVAGCGAGSSDSVPWKDYTPGLQATIDGLKASKNCDQLERQFQNADANDAMTKSRTGHNNAKLMTYIDKALAEAGCYRK
jgi:hypothetical protein